jgi:TonB family protein
MQLLSLYKLSCSGTTDRFGSCRVVSSPKVSAPFSFLHTIFLPEFLHFSDKELFLLHESAHVNNRHSLDILLNEMFLIFFWFNPIFWIAKRTIKNLHEYQADQVVIASKQDICSYRALIVKESLGSLPYLSHTFNGSITKKRIIMLTKPLHTKCTALRIFFIVPFLILNLALFSFTSRAAVLPVESVAFDSVPFEPVPVSLQDTTKSEVLFESVEVKPQFLDGTEQNFAKWVNDHINYPLAAKDKGIQGRVILTFIVDRDGSITDIAVLRGVDPDLDREAIRVIASSPKWTPGINNAKIVKVRYNFPIIFLLR